MSGIRERGLSSRSNLGSVEADVVDDKIIWHSWKKANRGTQGSGRGATGERQGYMSCQDIKHFSKFCAECRRHLFYPTPSRLCHHFQVSMDEFGFRFVPINSHARFLPCHEATVGDDPRGSSLAFPVLVSTCQLRAALKGERRKRVAQNGQDTQMAPSSPPGIPPAPT